MPGGVSDTKSQSPKNMDIYDEEIDGVPMEEEDDIDGVPFDDPQTDETKLAQRAFIPSKWETVDPDQVRLVFSITKFTLERNYKSFSFTYFTDRSTSHYN